MEGLTFCDTMAFPEVPGDDRTGMILYGDTGAEDPYDCPMIGLLWNPDDGSLGHAGDGDARPVSIGGKSGLAAPITVFQQVVLPELGTVIAWTEGDYSIGLYGRGWPMDRNDELVAIAERLEEDDGGFRLPDDALPEGYGEVFAGDPSVVGVVFPGSALYSLSYQVGEWSLQLHGLQMTEDEFEAFRFFTIGIDQGEAAGREVLIGNAWRKGGPAVLTWREPDGLVVRIVGIGVSLDTARQLASAARELNSDEWAALLQAENPCEIP